MRIICLDLEGVLIPEIWISLADITGIEKLKLTTRDIEDYDKLMSFRLKILREKKLKINDKVKANYYEKLQYFIWIFQYFNKSLYEWAIKSTYSYI